MTTERKVYLGDSVYAEFEHGMIRLTTDNGMGPSNEIFLEPEVIQALVRFAVGNRIPLPCSRCGGGGFVGGLHTSGPETIPCPSCQPPEAEDDGEFDGATTVRPGNAVCPRCAGRPFAPPHILGCPRCRGQGEIGPGALVKE
jgi:hypothetical protein